MTENNAAKSEKKNGRKAIITIRFKGTQFSIQMENEAPNMIVENTISECFATIPANGYSSQNSGIDNTTNINNETLETIRTMAKFEMNSDKADTTRPAA